MVPHIETMRPVKVSPGAAHLPTPNTTESANKIKTQMNAFVLRESVEVGRNQGSRHQRDNFTKLSKESLTTAQEAQNQNGTYTKTNPNNTDAKLDINAEGEDGLTEAERRKVQELKARDRQVREHERAHQIAGGHYASSPTYRTVRGPDGKSYAVGGEVRIDTSVVPNNPEATIRKMQTVKRAALAPQEPSSADRAVAAEADAKIVRARQEIQERKIEEAKERREKGDNFVEGGQIVIEAQKLNGDLVFDPEHRFKGEPIGLGSIDYSALIGLNKLPKGHGVLDPGQLFSLIA